MPESNERSGAKNGTFQKVVDFFDRWGQIAEHLKTLAIVIGGAAALIFGAFWYWKSFGPAPPPAPAIAITGFKVSEILKTDSKSLDNLHSFASYVFDDAGKKFNYHKLPPVSGYVISYSVMASGIGICEVDYTIQDAKTGRLVIPKTQIETVRVMQTEPIAHEFFIARDKHARRELVVVSLSTDPEKSPNASDAVNLAGLDQPIAEVAYAL